MPRARLALLTLTAAFFLVPAAQAAAGTYNINFNGPGTGTVTSNPAGISCSDTGGSTTGTCSAEFGAFTTVELTATGDPGSQLAEWSGNLAIGETCSEGSANPCHFLSLFETATITANFESLGPQQLLKVAESGTGAGTVTSSPSGIACGATCEHNFNEGSPVTLTATPNEHSTFAGWHGADAAAEGCDETGATLTCEVEMTAARSVEAEFTAIPQQLLTVATTGAGEGEVTGTSPGSEFTAIACGSTCSAEYNENATITLTATPAVHNRFTGWKGADAQAEGCDETGATLTCEVEMSAAKSIEAEFEPIPQQTLTVAPTGSGEGFIASSPSGIECGATCSAEFDQGTAVTVSAVPASGSRFTGWSGDCSGTAACEVTLNSNSTVAAAFERIPPPTASTDAPSDITQTTATLNGTVNGQRADTRWYFRYVDAADYDATAPNPYSAGATAPGPGQFVGDAGVVSTDTPVSTDVTGLSPNTIYHYQLVDCNVSLVFGFFCVPPSNQAFGADQTFITLALPPVVHTGLPTGLGPDTATVHGSVTPQGAATTYHLEYVDAAGYEEAAPNPYAAGAATTAADAGSATSAQSVAIALTGLAPNTTYHYRIDATNNGGTTLGEDQTLTTYGIAPTVETGAASNLGATTATLAGGLDPQGSDTSYRFQYGTTTNYGAGAPVPEAGAGAGTGPQAVSTDLSGLQPATTYHYRLIAINGSGVSYGADRTFTTQAGPPPPPPAAGHLALPTRAAVQNGAASLGVQCGADPGSSCAGRLSLTLGKTKLGTAGYSVDAGQGATVEVNLNRAARRLLAKARHNRLSVLATATPSASGAEATSRKLTLSEPGRRHHKRATHTNRGGAQ